MKFLILLLTVSLYGLAGCAHEPPPVLRVAGNIWPGYEPLYLARDLNYFSAAIHPVELLSATQVVRAFQNDVIDAACLTLDEALLLASQGEDFRVVLVADVSAGADVIVGTSGITRMTDIKGKRVGAEDTAAGAFFLTRALQESALRIADVRIVPLQAQDHDQAFIDGRVDALVTFEPTRGKLLARGARILFDSSRIPNEIIHVLVVRTGYLNRDTEVVADLLRGWYQAQDYMLRAGDDARVRMARREGVTVPQMRAALQGMHLQNRDENRQLLSGATRPLRAALQRLEKFMWEAKLLEKAVSVDHLIETRDLFAVSR